MSLRFYNCPKTDDPIHTDRAACLSFEKISNNENVVVNNNVLSANHLTVTTILTLAPFWV